MTATDPAAVRSLYGSAELRPLLAAARRRLEERDLELGGSVTLRGLTEAECLAVARVLGSVRLPADDVRVALADLDSALRRQSLELGLAEVLEALGGPLIARRAARRRQAGQRADLLATAAAHPAFRRRPDLVPWLDWVRSRGVVGRLDPEQGKILLLGALDVVAELPTSGVSLPVLAGRVTGATHALDRGTPLALLVERAMAFIAGEDPARARRRDLWGRFGVTLDAVSSTAIVLNLRPGAGPLAPLLGVAADKGEPIHVTLRMLRDLDALEVPRPVFLCENRSVIESAADALGSRSAPLVCLSGEPMAAGRRLVELLLAGGTGLRYHGDFDPDGIAIANSVIGPRVAPWRFGAADYRAAVKRTPVREELGPDMVRASWDARLAEAMAAAGARIYEEQVLDDLLVDLSTTPTVPRRGGAR